MVALCARGAYGTCGVVGSNSGRFGGRRRIRNVAWHTKKLCFREERVDGGGMKQKGGKFFDITWRRLKLVKRR